MGDSQSEEGWLFTFYPGGVLTLTDSTCVLRVEGKGKDAPCSLSRLSIPPTQQYLSTGVLVKPRNVQCLWILADPGCILASQPLTPEMSAQTSHPSIRTVKAAPMPVSASF